MSNRMRYGPRFRTSETIGVSFCNRRSHHLDAGGKRQKMMLAEGADRLRERARHGDRDAQIKLNFQRAKVSAIGRARAKPPTKIKLKLLDD